MFGLVKQLKNVQHRTPLGWLQLRKDRTKLLTALAGIAFADIMVFLQLGFQDALFRSNTQYPRHVIADLVIVSTQARSFNQTYTFPRRRLLQAMDIDGVASADALYINAVTWRNPETREKGSLSILGQNPDRPTFQLPEVNAQLDVIKLPDTVLFDKAGRGETQALIDQVEQGKTVTTEIGLRTVTLGGLFELGASFAADGAMITSDQNFLRFFPKREAGVVSMGLIDLQPDADPLVVQQQLDTYLAEDVQVFTYDQYIEFEENELRTNSSIAFIFGVGSAMGFVVGVVIVYQVLSTDVNAHMAEYATFKAMGYQDGYLLGVVFEEALILSILGFFPSLVVSIGLYQLTAAATALSIVMPVSRAVFILAMTVVMCGLSGAIATRRLQAADPADVF
ncbi:MAG: ABC transporter permease DevC [Cyanobacteria bacterium P01_A01_bin.114]